MNKLEVESTVEQYGNMVYRIAMIHCAGKKEDAEDVFQETFLALVRCRKHFESEEHLKAWLIRVALNQCKKKEIALSLELFVNDSLNIFNHQTNVDVDNRFVVYGIRDLGTELSPITMLANSEFVALLKQANTDSSKMAEVIVVSEAQLRFVTNSQSGMGLLKCGNVVISFDNQISKDTSLYKLYNTNLHEKVEMEKKEKFNQ